MPSKRILRVTKKRNGKGFKTASNSGDELNPLEASTSQFPQIAAKK